MEGELIVVALISTAGMIVMSQMWQMNWFKRENFRIKKKNIEGENRIKLKKLERELGLTGGRNPTPPSDSKTPIEKLGQLSPFLPILAKLDKDQLTSLIDHFIGGGFSEDQEEGDLGGIVEFADEHPDIVKSFLDGLGSEKKPSRNANY